MFYKEKASERESLGRVRSEAETQAQGRKAVSGRWNIRSAGSGFPSKVPGVQFPSPPPFFLLHH